MIIYTATNVLNGKVYVGRTAYALKSRMKYHIAYGKGILTDAIREFGEANFKWEIVYSAMSQGELEEKEMEFIKTLNAIFPNGYNLDGGGRAGTNRHPLTTQKQKRPKSAEHRRKLSEIKKGKPCPWLVESNKRRFGPWSATAKTWKVYCPDGSVLELIGIKQFCRERGLNRLLLSRTARRLGTIHRGYRAELLSEERRKIIVPGSKASQR